jgi:hypothetical protein
MPKWVPVLIGLLMATMAAAQEAPRTFTLAADEDLVQSGLLEYILPRFALKTGRRGELVEGPADLVLTDVPSGGAIFGRDGQSWYLDLRSDNDAAQRFADWLRSDIGLRTVESFAPAQGAPFGAVAQERIVEAIVFDGDPVLGAKVAALHCARCHRVSVEDTNSIGSTPSFMALKALADWSDRFGAFYVLNPHPSFMLVSGVSPDFNPARPPSIVPVILTLDEVEAVQAYVSGLAAADLGAPVAAK